MGLVPARGNWEYELFDTGSAVTFRQGSLVQFAGDRTLSEYSGGEPNWLGIAMHNSVNSVPAGKVLVAIPSAGGGCTAIADLIAGDAASGLSLGQAVGIQKSGNTVSFVTTGFTSAASKIAVIRGGVRISPVSAIEVAFLTDSATYLSSTSQTI